MSKEREGCYGIHRYSLPIDPEELCTTHFLEEKKFIYESGRDVETVQVESYIDLNLGLFVDW